MFSVISVQNFESVAILAQVFVFLALPIQIKPGDDGSWGCDQLDESNDSPNNPPAMACL